MSGQLKYETITLEACRELRFLITKDPYELIAELAQNQNNDSNNAITSKTFYHIKLKKGTAELFGIPLQLNEGYTLSIYPGSYAVYTWYGCTLEISSTCAKLYEEADTNMDLYAAIHGNLELLRSKSYHTFKGGPRVAVVGAEGAGKSTIARILAAYAIRCDRKPIYIDINTKDNTLCIPGTIAATVLEGNVGVGVVEGVKSRGPLTYWVGSASPSVTPELYQCAVSSLANAVDAKLRDGLSTSDGCIVDTFGLSVGTIDEEAEYELLLGALTTLRVDVVLCVGLDRLVPELTRDLEATTSGTSDPTGIHVIKISQTGAVQKLSVAQKDRARSMAIKRYFEGTQNLPLAPTHKVVALQGAATNEKAPLGAASTSANVADQLADFSEDISLETKVGDDSSSSDLEPVTIFKVHDKYLASEALLPVGQDSAITPTNATKVEKVGKELLRAVLAVSYADSEDQVLYATTKTNSRSSYTSSTDKSNNSKSGNNLANQNSNVAGFVFVESVDVNKNTLTILAPSPAPFPGSKHILLQGDISWSEL